MEFNILKLLNYKVTFPYILLLLFVGEFGKIRKNDVTLRRDNTIFKVIIAPTLKEFCFRVKEIHLQNTTKSPITESKFR